jgi:hypothetical protein
MAHVTGGPDEKKRKDNNIKERKGFRVKEEELYELNGIE